MGAIHRRIERLESAAGGGSFNLVAVLRDLNRRDKERRTFCANATEVELIAKLRDIDGDEVNSVAGHADPPLPPPEGAAQRWFHDLRYCQSPGDVRSFQDTCRRPDYVAALASRMAAKISLKPTPSHSEQLWPANWAREVISEARAQLSDGSPLTDAIVAALHKRIG
jgi:hypothetical protein